MSIETHFENMLKLDYAEAWYPVIVERLKLVQLPKKFYEPSVVHGKGKQEEIDMQPDQLMNEVDMSGEGQKKYED